MASHSSYVVEEDIAVVGAEVAGIEVVLEEQRPALVAVPLDAS